MTLARLFLLLAVAALLGCNHDPLAPPPGPAMAPGTHLRSPWDTTAVNITQRPYDCPHMARISPDILVTNGTAAQKNVSDAVKQAVYAESDVALHDLASYTVAAADNFQHTGSQAAARCVVTLLAGAAADHSMAGYMGDGDAVKEQNQALRAVAIAYLKIRPSGLASPDEHALISAWMDDIAHSEQQRMQHGPCGQKFCDLHGHTGLSVAMAAGAVGVATGDEALFRWSIAQYRAAVSAIDPNGTLHYDTHGAYALKFMVVSAGDLVQIAEFGETNGLPMYAFANGRIHLLVHTVSRGLIDSGTISGAAGVEQKMSKTVEPWQISWAAVYNRRFPDAVLSGLLQQIGPRGADMWGGEPWDA